MTDLIQVEIKALAYGSGCIGVIKSGPLSGKKVFLENTLPGELVEARINSDKGNFAHASMLRVLERAEGRVEPPCPYFVECGGCELQHMTIETQRREKLRMVADTLRFQARLEAVNGVKLCGEHLPSYAYRRRIAVHVNEAGLIGFYRQGTGDVVDIRECMIADPAINLSLSATRPLLSRYSKIVGGAVFERDDTGVSMLIKMRSANTPPTRFLEECKSSIEDFRIEAQGKIVLEQRRTGTSNFPTGHFSQVNDAGNRVLIDEVCSTVRCEEVTELYAGAGNFSFDLLNRVKRVDAVEIDSRLVRFGEERALAANVADSLRFFEISCEKFLRKYDLRECVVLDPPRSGAKNLVEFFNRKVVNQIVYVSCNLPSLCRDLVGLTSRGFTLRELRVVDMFPQTHHVEIIALLD
jgi:23S rRNA (uracil1939-C5)-methyltransferase